MLMPPSATRLFFSTDASSSVVMLRRKPLQAPKRSQAVISPTQVLLVDDFCHSSCSGRVLVWHLGVAISFSPF